MEPTLNPNHSAGEAIAAFTTAYVVVSVGGYLIGRALRKRYILS